MQVLSFPRPSAFNDTGHVDVSTSFVNRLHSYSSPSSSIASTPRDGSPVDIERAPPSRSPDAQHPNPEQTPLIGTADSHHPPSHHRHSQDSSYGAVQHHVTTHSLVNGDASEYFEGHHRHESRSSHLSHHERSRPTTMYGPPGLADGRPSDVGHAHYMESGHHHHGLEDTVDATGTHEHHHFHHHHHSGHEAKIRIGKKRQIVGILVRLDFELVDLIATHASSRYYN
ncbi:hypothetical protein JVT61DRAFT_7648 [Boletus reticuloceps]|uniref:Uncharacterized protein n=1 Tax=Boletus reticuloceps TaxID=495285 RepID=A0A8I2YIK7_9AGAM|nr:hypothetical protein JVT61DRAFT_7648 [Boletus reticuloceps]